MSVRVGPAEGPPGGREPEAEGGAAEERETDELAEGNAHDPGRDGDEGANDGCGEADRHRPVVEPTCTATPAKAPPATAPA